jgi:RHS repeat-associated protein
MTSDGTNGYAWDAENRLIKITYPGVNNYSTFGYDGLSRNISIIETTAGSVTSTKQFVWCPEKLRFSDERDASGVLTKKFFDLGQMIGSTKYCYNRDHLESVREQTDSSGAIQSQYQNDPFGRTTNINAIVLSDFGYARYYYHARSSFNVPMRRLYNPAWGRFVSPDPVVAFFDVNFYWYGKNNPVSYSDPSGLRCDGPVSCVPCPVCDNPLGYRIPQYCSQCTRTGTDPRGGRTTNTDTYFVIGNGSAVLAIPYRPVPDPPHSPCYWQ